MAIKFQITADEFGKLTKEIQALYVQEGEGYHLDAEGNPLETKLKEFRDNNIQLMKDITKAQSELKKFEGIDEKKARAALQELNDLKEKKLISDGEIEKVLAQRTERMQADHQTQTKILTDKIANYESQMSSLKNQLSEVSIDKEIQLMISQIGSPQKGAVQDIIRRGRQIFKIDDKGSVTAVDEKGNTRFGKDGLTPLTIKEWAEALPTEAPFLFEPSKGIGSPGSGSPLGGTRDGKKILISNDPVVLGKNVEDIAAGKVIVQSPV